MLEPVVMYGCETLSMIEKNKFIINTEGVT
jgi:hypothetical protein